MSTAIVSPFRMSRLKLKRQDSFPPAPEPPDGGGVARPAPAGDEMTENHPAGTRDRTWVLEHPVARPILAALRDRETPPEQFRLLSHRLLLILMLEATRTLPVREAAVEKPVVLLSLARHGLGLAHQMADFIPDAAIGVISLDRVENKRPQSRLHLLRAPALSDARVILFDPVVATGLSSCLALDLVRRSGASDITLLSLVMSSAGLERIQAADKDISIWAAAIDGGWDAKLGPLPGIGNFAERLYG